MRTYLYLFDEQSSSSCRLISNLRVVFVLILLHVFLKREKVSAGHGPRQRQQIFLSEDTTQIPSDNLEEMKEKVKELDNFKEDLNDSY